METSPSKTATETSDGTESSPSTKKKKKAGAFVVSVEAKPEAARTAEAERPRSLVDRFLKDDAKETPSKAGEKAEKSEKPAADVQESSKTASDEAIEPRPEENGTLEVAVPLEELAEEEVQYLEEALTAATAQAETEQADEGDELTAQIEAEAVARFRQRIIEQHLDAETAAEETLAEIEAPAPEVLAAEAGAAPAEPAPSEDDETGAAGETDEEAGTSTPASAAPPAGPPSGAGGSGGGGSGGNRPPGGTPASPGFGGANVPPVPPYFTAANTAPASPDTRTEHIDDGGNAAGAALIGGIIGYFIGRRRGRIKTEKRLLPIQKKLEKQVEDISWQLREKEAKIRRAARQHAEVLAAVPTAAAAGRFEGVITNRAPERRAVAAEANQLHRSKPALEKIGHVLVGAELRPASEAATQHRTERLPANKHVETMNRTELLALSERVIIDGASLRQIYETKLVSEKGLRRLLSEYLRGGDVKRALRREIVEREVDFERDPVMRDHSSQTAQSSGGSGGNPITLQGLLQKAEAVLPSDASELQVVRVSHLEARAKQQRQTAHKRLTDFALIGTIVVLAVLVLVLLLTR